MISSKDARTAAEAINKEQANPDEAAVGTLAAWVEMLLSDSDWDRQWVEDRIRNTLDKS